MRCAGCEAKAVQIGELESELAAWRANDADAERIGFETARMKRWRERVKARPSCVQIMQFVADRPGRVVSFADLFRATRTDETVWNDVENERRLAYVILSQARAALRGTPGEGALESVWGRGVMMAPETAARLKAWVGEAA